MEIFQLGYFEAIARRGSLRAAAHACHVSPSSLSVQMRNLEQEVGARLFERRSRGLILTRAGERLLLTARRIRQEADQARRDLRRREFGFRQRLSVGIQPMLAAEILARPLGEFLARREDLLVEVRERTPARLLEALVEEEMDLCLLTLPPALPPGIEVKRLRSLRYAAFFTPELDPGRGTNLRLRDLRSHRLLLFADPAGLAERMSSAAGAEAEPRVIFSSDQAMTVFEMAAHGIGIAVLPALFRERADRRGLLHRPLRDAGLVSHVGVAWSRHAGLSGNAQDLIDGLFAPG